MARKKPIDPECVVTDAHRDQFAACVEYWRDTLGLHDWRINVSKDRAKTKVMAEVYKFDLEQRMATIKIGTDFGKNAVTERELSDLAFHEVFHIFLYEYKQFCRDDNSEEDILSVEHRIINVMERIIAGIPFNK
jgi:hypothetical protein